MTDLELNAENFNKLLQKANGLEIATQQERERARKEKEEREKLAQELDAYKQKELQDKEERAKKNGEFETLLKEREEQWKKEKEELLEKSKKAEAWEEFEKKQAEALSIKEQEISERIPQDVKEKYSDITAKMDQETRVAFYERIQTEVKDFGKPPKKGADHSDFTVLPLSTFQKLPTEKRKEYMKKSLEVNSEVIFAD